MGRVVYATAVSLDGFVADDGHGLSWLLGHEGDPARFADFEVGVGAMVMGRSTFDWVVAELARTGSDWPHVQPCWVLTHRPGTAPLLGAGRRADVRFTSEPADRVVAEMRSAAGDGDLWCVGGGETAAWLHRADLLDELVVTFAPEILGSGRPLLPARTRLELLATDRDGPFVTARYRILH